MNRKVTTLPVTELTVADGNWDSTRKPIDMIIIHTMVGTLSSANARFNNPSSQVSAHYGIDEEGNIFHWVDEDNTAYHAGDYSINQRSIGIEHEDDGDYNGIRPDPLYVSSGKLVRDICQFYNIPIDRDHIKKHSEVHPTGCPDALDIDRIVREAVGSPPPSAPDNNIKKAIQFDRILIEAHKRSITPDDTSENWVDDDKLVNRLFDHIDTQEEEKKAALGNVAILETFKANVKKVVYDKWVALPRASKNSWQNQLHNIKRIYEKGI